MKRRTVEIIDIEAVLIELFTHCMRYIDMLSISSVSIEAETIEFNMNDGNPLWALCNNKRICTQKNIYGKICVGVSGCVIHINGKVSI